MTDEIQEETTRPLSDPNLIDFIINHQLDKEPKFSLKEIDINGVACFFNSDVDFHQLEDTTLFTIFGQLLWKTLSKTTAQ